MQPRMMVKRAQMAWVDTKSTPAYKRVNKIEAAERGFVQQYTFALTMSQPPMSQDRRDLAYFTQELYQEGEIDLTEFLGRMHRLFPERVELLSDMLRAKLVKYLNL